MWLAADGESQFWVYSQNPRAHVYKVNWALWSCLTTCQQRERISFKFSKAADFESIYESSACRSKGCYHNLIIVFVCQCYIGCWWPLWWPGGAGATGQLTPAQPRVEDTLSSPSHCTEGKQPGLGQRLVCLRARPWRSNDTVRYEAWDV